MPQNTVGVNVEDAHGAGGAAGRYAAGFNGLHADFNDVLQSAEDACKDDPQVTGWSTYGSEQAGVIAEVEEHGVSLAENVQGGAAGAANSDAESGELYESVDVPLPRSINLY